MEVGGNRALTSGSDNCCSRWGRKAVDTLEMGHLPANTWGCSPWALTLLHLQDTWKAPEGTAGRATHVTLFVSPELWQVGSGEPEAQRLAPISGAPHPGLADSPAPSPTNWDRDGYRLLPAHCFPKAPNPSAYSLGYSSIRHNAGSRRQREKTEDMRQLGWAGLGWAIPATLVTPQLLLGPWSLLR